MDTLRAGTHSIVVSAVDAVGNATSRTVTFVVRPTLAGLLAAVNDGASRGLISAATQANLVSQIQSAMKGNSAHAKLGSVATITSQQSGTTIQSGYASLLLSWTNDLLLRV